MTYLEAILATAGIQAVWPLNEATGNAVDAKNANNGEPEGTLTRAQASILPNGEGASCNFGGGGFKVPKSATVDIGEAVTIEAWVKPSSVATFKQILDLNTNSAAMSLNEGKVEMGKSGVATLFFGTPAIAVNTAHHVVVVKNGATRKVYVDGKLLEVTVKNEAAVAANELAKFIGKTAAGGSAFAGNIQYLALYNVALEAAKIEEHFKIGAASNATIVAPPASATASAPTPLIPLIVAPKAASATASAPTPSVGVGPAPSRTDNKRGLPLPFPSILANPARLGPPRFTATERKTLRIGR